MSRPLIVSVCDYSGAWSQPFADAGYLVLQVDPKLDTCDHKGNGYGDEGTGKVMPLGRNRIGIAWTAGQLAVAVADEGGYFLDQLCRWECVDDVECFGLLLAPPCTDYSSSGARWFAAKDEDGRTNTSNGIIRDCLSLVDLLAPDFWCLENPVGRLRRCVPEVGAIRMRFDPCDYAGFADSPDAEAYTKRTCLYGDFDSRLVTNARDPVWYYDKKGNRGSWQWKHLGGKSERTKELRSMTPVGFSRAFAAAQIFTPHPRS